jgi:hypothetical protein
MVFYRSPDGRVIQVPAGSAADRLYAGRGYAVVGGDEELPEDPFAPLDPLTPASQDYSRQMQAAIDYIDNSDLDESFKTILRQVVGQWDFSADNAINMDKILKEYRKIEKDIISPEFQAKSNAFKNELTASRNFLLAQREAELETERLTAGEDIRQAKEGLESAGLTFTGRGVQELGGQSAYGQISPEQAATNVANPLGSQPTVGGLFYEGKVNQLNRLMSQGSDVKFRQNVDVLGRQAEEMLGSGNVVLTNLPGYTASGGIRGQIETQKQQALADTLTNIAAQQDKNRASKEPVYTTDVLNQF